MAAEFRGFEEYSLTGVSVSDRELGHGSYATILEVEYLGLKCAGKKIHEILLKPGDTTYALHRFEHECRILTKIRHPNIVQFLGVYFQQGSQVPVLVMELLHTDLTTYIEQHGALSNDIGYSVLHDVALGLYYLHSQNPPIIHRDLSSNNVLLTSNMGAKISDLGVARILNLSPLQVSRMTQTPGTPAYMPPEVMVTNPKYSSSIDVFSYGILIIHVLSGSWPETQIGPVQAEIGMESDRLIPVSEAERRTKFLEEIGMDHPSMHLILKCINNHPRRRPQAKEITEHMAEMTAQFPPSFQNRLETIACNRETGPVVEREYNEKICPVSEGGLHDTKHTHLLIENLNTQNEVLQAEKMAATSEQRRLKSENLMLSNQIKQHEDSMKIAISSLEDMLETEREASRQEIEEEKRAHLKEKMEHNSLKNEYRKATIENVKLKAEISMCNVEIQRLHVDIDAQNDVLSAKNMEIAKKTAILESKNAIITTMNDDFAKSLLSKQQVTVTWKRCSDLKVALYNGKATVLDDNIYVGGANADTDFNHRLIQCYNPSLDSWTTLPPLTPPFIFYGIGEVSGKLVTVGGMDANNRRTGKVLSFIEQTWKEVIPPMPTARNSAAVTSLESMLLVVGGFTGTGFTSTVELFNQETAQWYTTHSIPTPCMLKSLVVLENVCYALGGENSRNLNEVLQASVDELIKDAVVAGTSVQRSSKTLPTQSAWKVQPNTPSYRPAATVLSDSKSLLAVGGFRDLATSRPIDSVYVYSPTTKTWRSFSYLPTPCVQMTTIALSTTEFLVIGGQDNCDKILKTVYKCSCIF